MPLAVHWYKSLRYRTVLCMAVLSLCVIGPSGYLFISRQAESTLQGHRNTYDSALEITANALGIALWNFDDKAALDYLKAMEHIRGFCGGRIYDKQGQVFVSYKWSDPSNSKSDPHKQSKEYLKKNVDFKNPNNESAVDVLGILEVCNDQSFIITDVKEQQKILVALVLGLITSLVALGIISLQIVFKPLTKLGESMKLVKMGLRKIDDPELLAQNEIGQLGQQFNTMMEDLDRLYGELECRIIEARQASEAKSLFLSNMSHELRTPMHAIITFSRQGIERITRWTGDEHKENLELIKSSGERLLRLINNLLDLSKLESGTAIYNLSAVNSSELVKSCVRQVQSLLDEKELKLDIETRADLPMVVCDQDKMSQVLINLLSNSIKFTPKGKGLKIRYGASDDESPIFLFTLSDDGIGIPENELESVFDKFIQSSTTKTGAGGTGLGLAICKEIVEAHDGRIWAYNNPGGGCSFNIILPLVQPFSHEV